MNSTSVHCTVLAPSNYTNAQILLTTKNKEYYSQNEAILPIIFQHEIHSYELNTDFNNTHYQIVLHGTHFQANLSCFINGQLHSNCVVINSSHINCIVSQQIVGNVSIQLQSNNVLLNAPYIHAFVSQPLGILNYNANWDTSMLQLTLTVNSSINSKKTTCFNGFIHTQAWKITDNIFRCNVYLGADSNTITLYNSNIKSNSYTFNVITAQFLNDNIEVPLIGGTNLYFHAFNWSIAQNNNTAKCVFNIPQNGTSSMYLIVFVLTHVFIF